jgi:hypothetical protein
MASLFHRPKPSALSGSPWWAGILPWVVFGVAQEWCPPLAGPLALAVFALAYWRTRLTLPALDAGIAAYFLIYSLISLTGLEQKMPPRILFALCPAVLAITAALSVAVGQPFTLAYARQYAPEHIQGRPSFFLANQIITLLWVAGFATAAITIGSLRAEWNAAQAAIILISALGAAMVASAATGFWFHTRESRVTT